jgi:hypothetical protein
MCMVMDFHYSLAFSEFLVSYMLYSLALGNRPHVWAKKYDITLFKSESTQFLP